MGMNNKSVSGFSLIELLVAMVIGLIILLGLVSVFTASSSLNRTQSGLAVLQENGRYAITRIKQDIEVAGRKHCATVAMPSSATANWHQGYAMSEWRVAGNVTFDNGLPNATDVMYDDGDDDQMGNNYFLAGDTYPLDPSFFIRGHNCVGNICLPDVSSIGADLSVGFPDIGSGDGNRAKNTDILTVRYLTGGNRITGSTDSGFIFKNATNYTDDEANAEALIADCQNAYVAKASWSDNTEVTITVPENENPPRFLLTSDVRAYNMEKDFKTVSYFIQIDDDPNDDGARKISSLYRSENGVKQQLVEGVERMDLFYLAQIYTGEVVRLTADEVQDVSGGPLGEPDAACILPPPVSYLTNKRLSNDAGCLWRSIYAIEVHLLMNTVDNSATTDDEPFIYTPDSVNPQTPLATLPSDLPRERMYRREFTAVVPIRSYAL